MAGNAESLTRDEKIKNLITNHTLIFMGMFEEAFSTIAEKLTETMSLAGSAIADAIAGSGTGQEIKEMAKADIAPEVRREIERAFSEIREEMASQWPKNPEVFNRYISNPDFDKGILIVEKFDFGRPKITERLDDQFAWLPTSSC